MSYNVTIVDRVTIVKGSIEAQVLVTIIDTIHQGRDGYVSDALLANHYEGFALGHKDDCEALRSKLGLSL